MNYVDLKKFVEATAKHRKFSFFTVAVIGAFLVFFSISYANAAFAYHGLAVLLYCVLVNTLRTVFENLAAYFNEKWFVISYITLELILALLLAVYLSITIVDSL